MGQDLGLGTGTSGLHPEWAGYADPHPAYCLFFPSPKRGPLTDPGSLPLGPLSRVLMVWGPHFPRGSALTAVLLFQEYFAHVAGEHEAEQLRRTQHQKGREESEALSSSPARPCPPWLAGPNGLRWGQTR